jgi:hypothetical protein
MNAVAKDEPPVRYVHVARGLLFDGVTLTLVDLSPSTIWVSSTPDSGVGYLPTGDFLDLWEPGPDTTPAPRRVKATLGLLDPDALTSGNAALMLSKPRVTAAGLAYAAQIVQGLVPARSGACGLFLEWHSTHRRGRPRDGVDDRLTDY